jgi:hypothetical protein
MAAGVKPAAIVNYEKYVTHPVPPAPAKKDAKPKAKAAVHHAPAKKAPVKTAPAQVKPAQVKLAPVNQAALKPNGSGVPVAAAKDTAATHPVVSPPPAAVATGQKKPSAGIPKETPQN